MEGYNLYITYQNDKDIDAIELPYTTDEYKHPENGKKIMN